MRLLLPVVLVSSACGGPLETESPALAVTPERQQIFTQIAAPPSVHTLPLRLETRDGDSALGWRLDPLERVPLAHAAMHLNSWDCGARGRWVELRSAAGLEFCVRPNAASVNEMSPSTDDCLWSSSFEVGGSRGEFVGVTALVRQGDRALGRLRVSRTTTLAQDWYAQTPIAPFEVELEYLPAR